MHVSASGDPARARLRPASRWMILVGLVAFVIGGALWLAFPATVDTLIKGCVFVPLAALGILCSGIGILVSWSTLRWPLRLVGIILVALALGPLILLGTMFL